MSLRSASRQIWQAATRPLARPLTRQLALAGLVSIIGLSWLPPAAVAQTGSTSAQVAVLQAMPKLAGAPATSRQAQMAALGYVEQELLIKGQSQAFEPASEWRKDGIWPLKELGTPQPFATRVLVRRPQDPARFNGTVLVEWLNTSLGFDLDGAWALTRDELVRDGYAWVGVSAEAASVESLKSADPARYAPTSVAHSGHAFDIFTQAAERIRQMAPQWGTGSTPPIKVLALGYSQSGSFLITYINAFQPRTHAFNGFYAMSTAAVGMKIEADGGRIFNTAYRPDLEVPVMQVSNEMEVVVGWQLSKTPDTDKLRHWEMAGATHLDRHMQEEVLAAGTHASRLAMPNCWKPSNVLPTRMFNHAALHALNIWVRQGTPPPIAPRMTRSSWGFLQDDELGNVKGGLRMPELDVPTAQYGLYSNLPRSPISAWTAYACMAGGSANPLDAKVLRARYPDEASYVQAYKQAADKLLAAGFLLPQDHAVLLKQAQAFKLPR